MWVLDASAVLAFLHGEPGADAVSEALVDVSVVSAANWAEILSKFSDEGEDPDTIAGRLEFEGVLFSGLEVLPVTAVDARMIARLRPLARSGGLSLGDRACLALALRLGYGVLTADRQWANLDLGLEIIMIR